MNLAGLIALFRRDADDNRKPYQFSNSMVIDAMNEAEEEACIRARLIVDSVSIQAKPGTAQYKLPVHVTEIRYASLTDSGGRVYVLIPTDRLEMDRITPDWRSVEARPAGIIHDDKTITVAPLPDADYTLSLEVHRLPKQPMAADADEPEIAAQHHRQLVHWALFRCLSAPDAETFDPDRAATAEGRFTRYFGKRPDASVRRKQQANRPHHNKVW